MNKFNYPTISLKLESADKNKFLEYIKKHTTNISHLITNNQFTVGFYEQSTVAGGGLLYRGVLVSTLELPTLTIDDLYIGYPNNLCITAETIDEAYSNANTETLYVYLKDIEGFGKKPQFMSTAQLNLPKECALKRVPVSEIIKANTVFEQYKDQPVYNLQIHGVWNVGDALYIINSYKTIVLEHGVPSDVPKTIEVYKIQYTYLKRIHKIVFRRHVKRL